MSEQPRRVWIDWTGANGDLLDHPAINDFPVEGDGEYVRVGGDDRLDRKLEQARIHGVDEGVGAERDRLMEALEPHLQMILNVLGPVPCTCSGSQYEVGEAIKHAKHALAALKEDNDATG